MTTLCRRASVVAAAVAVLAAPTAAAGAPNVSVVQYDCLEGYDNWRTWSDEKKAWCCPEAVGDSAASSLRSINAVGCVLPPEILHSARVAQDDYPNKYAAIAEAYGESTTTTYTTTPTEQVPLGWPECGMLCEIDGRHGSCASQTRWAASQIFVGRPDACEDARRMVGAQCRHCDGCSLEEIHCVSPPEIVTPPVPPAPAICVATCAFEDHSASCKDIVHWVAVQNFGGRPNSCETAYDDVLEQCSHCGGCSKLDVCGQTTLAPPNALAPTGGESSADAAVLAPTTPLTTPPPVAASLPTTTWTYTTSNLYDCSHQETCETWGDEQRQWCYWQAGVVCEEAPVTATATTTTLLVSDASYDCQALLNSLEAAYSEERTAWCCKYRRLGCLSDVEGVGVKPGQGLAFRMRYNADDAARPPLQPTEVPEDMRMQGTRWVAWAAVFGGCAMLGSLLVVGRLRPPVDARVRGYDYDDVLSEGREPLGLDRDAELGDAEVPEHPEAE